MRGFAIGASIVCLASCAVPVESPAGADAGACRAFLNKLPGTLDGQQRREVTPGDALGAAWGDPAYVLRCGAQLPEEYSQSPTCDRIEGVDWFVPESAASDQTQDAVLVTLGRSPSIELTVPAKRRPPVDALIELAEYIKANTTQTEQVCR
jgi:hypothetical protein